MKAIEIDMADDNFNFSREYYYDHRTLTLTKVGEKEKIVKTNGKNEGEGIFYVDKDGDIIIEKACNEDYGVSNSKEDSDTVIDNKGENGNPIKDLLDSVITLNGRIVEKIDTSKEGCYTITYSNGKTASVIRKVVILDMKHR